MENNDLENIIDGFQNGEKIQSVNIDKDSEEILELISSIKDPFTDKNCLLKSGKELSGAFTWKDLLYSDINKEDNSLGLSKDGIDMLEKIAKNKNTTSKALITEALNDLFIKHDEDPVL